MKVNETGVFNALDCVITGLNLALETPRQLLKMMRLLFPLSRSQS